MIDELKARITIVGGHADVWRLFDDPHDLRRLAAALVQPFRGDVTKVAGIEARGFVLATVAALELGVGLVPIRKEAGLFPGPKVERETDPDYLGRRHRLRLQSAALEAGDRVLLVDDWIETASQARAAKKLVDACEAEFVGMAVVVRDAAADRTANLGRVHALVDADALGWERRR